MIITSHSRNLEREKILVLVSPWKVPSFFYFLIERKIPNSFGFIHYSFPKAILSEDPFLTKKHFHEIIDKISGDLLKLKEKNSKEFYMYSQSLGCLFCMIVADKVPIKKLALIVPGINLAESFWVGRSSYGLRKKMEETGIILEKLKKIWQDISPDSYFKDNILNSRFFIVLSRKDRVIPYEDGLRLIELLKEKDINFTLIESRLLSHQGLVLLDIFFARKSTKFLFS